MAWSSSTAVAAAGDDGITWRPAFVVRTAKVTKLAGHMQATQQPMARTLLAPPKTLFFIEQPLSFSQPVVQRTSLAGLKTWRPTFVVRTAKVTKIVGQMQATQQPMALPAIAAR